MSAVPPHQQFKELLKWSLPLLCPFIGLWDISQQPNTNINTLFEKK